MDENTSSLTYMANAVRALAMDAVEKAASGHPGMPMGMADVATVLFARHLVFDPAHPEWPDRDRFVLSAGHGSMLLYALLHLSGYSDMTIGELQRFRQLGSRTAGHPEYGHAYGIETTTGPLGQGLATAVGMAIAESLLEARFGSEIVDHRTWVIASDGDLMEGISHEACSLAGHLGLAKLTVLFDDNEVTIDGPTDLAVSDDQVRRFEAYGWQALAIDGHDLHAIERALRDARLSDRPTFIACRTVIGKGAPTKAGKAASHGAPLGGDEIEGARAALNWPYAPFEVPDDIRAEWLGVGARGHDRYTAWRERVERLPCGAREELRRVLDGRLPADLDERIEDLKRRLSHEASPVATRKASEGVLEVLAAAVPEMVGGSADLTGSNNTKTKAASIIKRGDFRGRYIHFGIREHAMTAAMNGMALHRGVIPFGGTFLIFTDYAKPALRLAALMRQRLIFVATHDSIGLGEDGPTHQPIEQLAGLRAVPNLLVFRPADAVETAECWLAALHHTTGPSVLALTRQSLPTVRTYHRSQNLAARGAYVLSETTGERQATILATGSEVVLALGAQALLKDQGIAAAVVSMPCLELFERQDPVYHASVLGLVPRVAVEAASPFGWTRYVASEDHVVGMRGFGASAPYKQLYEHFGLTPERIAERVRSIL